MSELAELTNNLLAFRDERDWAQFHTPQHLAAGLSIEAGELQELFLWKNPQEVDALIQDPAKKQRIAEELADVAGYVLLIAHATGIDLKTAMHDKLEQNKQKYPADRVRGSAKKYNEYL